MRNDRVYPCGEKVSHFVICGYDCASCGFNPTEQKRRLETGTLEEIHGIKTLHFRKENNND